MMGLRCRCGSAEIMAIAPGTDDPMVFDLFRENRGEPGRAWCAACWSKEFAAPAPAPEVVVWEGGEPRRFATPEAADWFRAQAGGGVE
jgi:hypothetical protein